MKKAKLFQQNSIINQRNSEEKLKNEIISDLDTKLYIENKIDNTKKITECENIDNSYLK
jgi:hypothetical protein